MSGRKITRKGSRYTWLQSLYSLIFICIHRYAALATALRDQLTLPRINASLKTKITIWNNDKINLCKWPVLVTVVDRTTDISRDQTTYRPRPLCANREEFRKGNFTLKTHQLFSVHTTMEKLRTVKITGHFRFVFERVWGKKIEHSLWGHNLKSSVLKMFSVYMKTESQHFQIPSVWRAF